MSTMRDRHEAAKERIKKAFWQIRQRPDLVGLGPMFDRIKDVERGNPSQVQTCATDGKKFYYSTEFVESLHQSVLRTVAMHEAMHVGHSHHLRLRNLFKAAGIDPSELESGKAPPRVKRRAAAIARRANEAMDHVINNQIVQSEAFQGGFLAPPPKDVWCCDPKYKDQTKWSFDRVFADLGGFPPEEPEEQDFELPPIPMPSDCDDDEDPDDDGDEDDMVGGGGNEEPDEDGDEEQDDQQGGSPQDPDDEGEEEDDQGGGGSSAPDGDDDSEADTDASGDDDDEGGEDDDAQDSDNEGSGEDSNTDGPGYQPVGGMGEVLPSPAQTKQEQEQEYQDINEDLARGEFMEKCMGSEAGTNKVLKTLRDSSIDQPAEWGWMKDLLSQAFSSERTWAKPNIYHMMDHGYLPGRDKDSGDLVVWCDMSGSMSSYELEYCRAELEFIAGDLGINKIYLGYFSNQPIQTPRMQELGTYFQELEVGAGDPVEFEITGRGGTIFDPCLRVTEEEAIDVQAMVVFTDGEMVIKEPEPPYPVIWATTNVRPDFRDRRTYEGLPGWGETVKLNIDKSKVRYW